MTIVTLYFPPVIDCRPFLHTLYIYVAIYHVLPQYLLKENCCILHHTFPNNTFKPITFYVFIFPSPISIHSYSKKLPKGSDSLLQSLLDVSQMVYPKVLISIGSYFIGISSIPNGIYLQSQMVYIFNPKWYISSIPNGISSIRNGIVYIFNPKWYIFKKFGICPLVYLGCGPLPVAVTTRMITFLVGNPYPP